MAKYNPNAVPYREELKTAVKRFVALNIAHNVGPDFTNEELDGIGRYVGDSVRATVYEAIDELLSALLDFANDKGVKIDG